jgi:hypothetical protein
VAHPHAYPLASVHPIAPIRRQGRRTAAREGKKKKRAKQSQKISRPGSFCLPAPNRYTGGISLPSRPCSLPAGVANCRYCCRYRPRRTRDTDGRCPKHHSDPDLKTQTRDELSSNQSRTQLTVVPNHEQTTACLTWLAHFFVKSQYPSFSIFCFQYSAIAQRTARVHSVVGGQACRAPEPVRVSRRPLRRRQCAESDRQTRRGRQVKDGMKTRSPWKAGQFQGGASVPVLTAHVPPPPPKSSMPRLLLLLPPSN